MAVTAIADIIDPEVLADQTSAKYPDKLVFAQVPGLIKTDASFPLPAPGTKFKMPFWKRMSGLTTLVEGTPISKNKVQAGSEFATVQRGAGAWSVYDTASLVSIADPISEISTQLAQRVAQYIDAKLVLEADKTPNFHDQAAIGSGLAPSDLVKAMTSTIGDNYADLVTSGAIIMHSKVYGDLLQLGAIQNNYQSGMDVLKTGTIPTLLGLPVFMSDRVTTATISSVVHYNTYIVGPEALALFYQRQLLVEFDRDILAQEDVIVATVHFASHLMGYDDQTSAVVAEDNKSIKVVKVRSK